MSFSDPKEKKKDCPEVVCEKSDPLGTYRKFAKQDQKIKFKDDDEFDSEDKNKKPVEDEDPYKFCPSNKQSLGFFTWTLLHTMAIYYPE